MSKAWMPLYVGDYLGDTNHLSQGQHGAYLLLIMHYWQRESLPADREQCYCIARAMDVHSRRNVDKVLEQFFCIEGSNYRHPRIDSELKHAKESYEKRVSAAKSRWGKQQSKSNATALHEQSQSQSQSYKNRGRGTPRPAYSQTDFDERDLRRLAEAKKAVLNRAQASIGAGNSFTEAEFMSAVCEESGLLPKRVQELEKKSKWAVASA